MEGKMTGWVARKPDDGTLRLHGNRDCSDCGIWVPPWAFNDSWKICTTDEPVEVEITIKRK